MRFVEDPSIAECARVEHAVMMDAILARYEAGEPYFQAREAVMAEHGPRIARHYGKETANRALRAVTSHRLSDLPRGSYLRHAAASHDRWLADMDRWFGPGHYFTARQRFFIRTLGVAHWGADPVATWALLAAAVASIACAWWIGWTSWRGIVLLLIAAVIIADGALSSAMPKGHDLEGDELERWRAAHADEPADPAEVEGERELENIKRAQRTLRDIAKQAERDADARARAVLQPPPPLDDFGKATIKPRGLP